MRLVLAALAAAAGAPGGPARAADLVTDLDIPEQAEAGAGDRTVYTLGLGVALAPDYEGSDDYRAAPLWNLRAGNLWRLPAVASTSTMPTAGSRTRWRPGPSPTASPIPGR